MPSSVIRCFAYDEKRHRLDVEFVSGCCYAYHDVPAQVVTQMRHAASKGSYFNRRIRDHFRFTRLEDAKG
jgi:hypothetical protein